MISNACDGSVWALCQKAVIRRGISPHLGSVVQDDVRYAGFFENAIDNLWEKRNVDKGGRARRAQRQKSLAIMSVNHDTITIEHEAWKNRNAYFTEDLDNFEPRTTPRG